MDRWQWAKRASWAVLALGSAAAASSVLLSGEPKSDSATRSWRLLHKKEVTEDLGYFYFTAPRRHPAAPSAAVEERAWRHLVFQEPTVSIVRAYSLLPCSLLFPEVTANEKRLVSTANAVALSERRLDAEQRKFSVGLSTSFFVFQAQRDLASTREALLRSALDYQLSVADLEAVQKVPIGGAGNRR